MTCGTGMQRVYMYMVSELSLLRPLVAFTGKLINHFTAFSVRHR